MTAVPPVLVRACKPITRRPHLAAGALTGVIFYLATAEWLHRAVTRGLLAWDLCAAVVIGWSLVWMINSDDASLKARAIAHDEGRHGMLTLSMVAAAASVVAIMWELKGAKDRGQIGEAISIGLTAATIALSWFFAHLVFAMHYAHVYYRTEARGDALGGGLDFPGDEAPDYWDFLYFAVVIGATAQTADVSIQSKEMRRIATVQCLVAFAFNTAILATMINLAAGLF